MIFWDASAIVPLLVEEPRSAVVRQLAGADPMVVVWWGTKAECLSAIARRERESDLAPADADQARQVLLELEKAWTEVLATEEVRSHACRVLLRHALRAADALQMGAALTWARGRPDGRLVATFDDRLAEACRREGFSLAGG